MRLMMPGTKTKAMPTRIFHVAALAARANAAQFWQVEGFEPSDVIGAPQLGQVWLGVVIVFGIFEEWVR